MPAEAFGVFRDKAEYDAAMAEWQRKKAAGDPFPGPMPRLDTSGQISDKLAQSGFSSDINNAAYWQNVARAGALAPTRPTPYDAAMADRARQAQLALIGQMRNQMAGPSLAGMQGQQALAQSGQRALGAAAMGAPNRAAMLQSQRVGAGLAGDVGQARLAEVMRAQGGMGGVASGLRGADIRSSGAYTDAALAQRRQDDAMRQFYASQGSGLESAQARSALELEKVRQRLALQARQNDIEKMNAAANTLGTVFGGLFK